MSGFIGALNYVLVLLFGILLTVSFAGACTSKKERRATAFLFFLILAVQMLIFTLFGFETTEKMYPFISHLPLVLVLVLVCKKPWGVALASVLTAYFCCQLPRWIGTLGLSLVGTPMAYRLSYMLSIIPLFFLLRRYLSPAVYQAMTYSKRSLLLFGGLPLFYYLFDYATTVYTDALYRGVYMVTEFLPAAMAIFYIAFITAYHHEMRKRGQLELDNAMLTAQSQGAQNELSALQQIQEQTSVYLNDMHQHFALIRGFLEVGDYVKADEYIRQTQADIDRIATARYCDNNAVNLILSSFVSKATQQGVTLSVEMDIPANLPFSETELCALLSNGIENAITAAAKAEGPRTVRINCQAYKGKLLIYMRNPYEGVITMRDDLPESSHPNHGYGAKIIKMIAEKHRGYYAFETEDGMFTLRVALPLQT